MENKVQKKEELVREKERLSNIVTSKMMVVFFALIFAVVLLLKMSSSSGIEFGFYQALPYVQIVSAVLFAGALAWHIVCTKRGVNAKEHVFSSPLLLGLSAALLFCALFYGNFGGAFRTILALLAFALLFFVYEIYAADFFLCSVAVITGCLSASVINSAGFNGMNVPVNCIAVALTLIATVGCAWVVYQLDKKGKLELFGKRLKKPMHMVPAAVYAGCAVSLLAVVGVLLFGHLLYCIAAVCVVYFIIAIIYTVKLM